MLGCQVTKNGYSLWKHLCLFKIPQESLNFQFLNHSKINIGKCSFVNIEFFFCNILVYSPKFFLNYMLWQNPKFGNIFWRTICLYPKCYNINVKEIAKSSIKSIAANYLTPKAKQLWRYCKWLSNEFLLSIILEQILLQNIIWIKDYLFHDFWIDQICD